jgi:phage minor structural protein
VTTVAGSGDTIIHNGGTVIETLESGAMISKIADYNAEYIQARAQSGNIGYVSRAKCEETETPESGEIIPAQDITDQPFRIYKIVYEDDAQSVVIEAKHISYDFQGNGIYSCVVTNADPMTAIAIMRGNLLDDDGRRIVSDITNQHISGDWSFLNPISALLDPDNGIVPKLGAALVRNGRDFYLLDNSHPRKGITLAYGKNLLGVRWTQDSESVITRVLPRCGDGNGGNLYIDNVYVESDISSNYKVQRVEMMNCGYAVGDEYEKPDGTVITLTEETAKEQMEIDAKKRFDIQRIDCQLVELEVQFLLLGETEEYAQYRGLETVCLYDEIEVIGGKSGMKATAQVAEYKYDSILRRFSYIRVGDVKMLTRKIPGYRMRRNSITYDKLGHDVVMKIRNAQQNGG